MSAGPSENAECRAMVHNLRARGCWVCKIASGADIGSRRTVAILKTLGLVPGVPDYIVVVPGGHLVLLEMKTAKGGHVTRVQRECHEVLRKVGAEVVVGRGAQHAVEQVVGLALDKWDVVLQEPG